MAVYTSHGIYCALHFSALLIPHSNQALFILINISNFNTLQRFSTHVSVHRQHMTIVRSLGSSNKDSCTKRRWFWAASTDLLVKASILTAFCARDSSPHLPVTPAQLMRPGIGQNVSSAEGDFAYHLDLIFGDVVHWLFFHQTPQSLA